MARRRGDRCVVRGDRLHGDSELGAQNNREPYYNLMVEGWLQGKLSLSLEAPAGLVALANPYDPAANSPYSGTMYYPPRVHDQAAAIREFVRAIADQPDSPILYTNLGYSLMLTGRRAEVEEALKRR